VPKKVTNQTIDSVENEIARRKKAREELVRYTDELKRRNEEVKQFAFIVSHDLRAPLVNLKGFAGELKFSISQIRDAISKMFPRMDQADREIVENALNQDIPEALGFIDSSVERMDVFINAVLKLSRLGRIRLHPTPVDTGALVREILKTLAHRIEKNDVSVVVEDLPNLVADNIAMEQIFGNLLANATAYLDPTRPGKVTVSGRGNGSETVFQVKDNGVGISERDMPMVFAPFRRAANPDIPGEGMGLAYVQALIRRCGGAISCESVPGEGSVFTFTIPDNPPSDD
jgi:signal transduction histidine kinase